MYSRRTFVVVAIFVIILAGATAEHVLAQAPLPNPPAPKTVVTLDPTPIPPFGIVLFTRESPMHSPGQPTPRGGFSASIRVANRSLDTATGTHTGSLLKIEAPDGMLIQLVGRALQPEPTPVPIVHSGVAPMFPKAVVVCRTGVVLSSATGACPHARSSTTSSSSPLFQMTSRERHSRSMPVAPAASAPGRSIRPTVEYWPRLTRPKRSSPSGDYSQAEHFRAVCRRRRFAGGAFPRRRPLQYTTSRASTRH